MSIPFIQVNEMDAEREVHSVRCKTKKLLFSSKHFAIQERMQLADVQRNSILCAFSMKLLKNL